MRRAGLLRPRDRRRAPLKFPSLVVRFTGNPLPDPWAAAAPWSDAVHAAAMTSINNLLLLGDGETWSRQSVDFGGLPEMVRTVLQLR